MKTAFGSFAVCCALAAAGAFPSPLAGEPVTVRHPEGVVHGFLVLKTPEGKVLADGDLVQDARGERVTSRLVFRFRDGSFQEETTVFSQRGAFRLLTDHLVQKGPAFPRELDMTVDVSGRRVTVRSTEPGKAERVDTDDSELPADLANGLVAVLLKNVPEGTVQLSVPMVVATPKPLLVRLRIVPAGDEPFAIGDSPRRAARWAAKLEIGGIKGVLAKLLGKQPPDSYVFILPGEAPAFVRSESPQFLGGAPWRLELTSPSWKR